MLTLSYTQVLESPPPPTFPTTGWYILLPSPTCLQQPQPKPSKKECTLTNTHTHTHAHTHAHARTHTRTHLTRFLPCSHQHNRGPAGLWTRAVHGESVAQISETLPVLAACQPTFAHMLLARLVSLGAVAFVVSQNCDGLHLRSGLDAQRLAELHGNCFIEFCPSCEHVRVMPCVVPNIVPCIVQLGGESKVQTCSRFNAWRTSTFKLALGEGDCADCWWLLCTVLYLCVSVSVCVFLASCPVSFWSSSDKFLEILGFLLGHSDHSEIFSAILSLYPPAHADFCSSVLHHLFLTTPCAAASRASDLLLHVKLSIQLLHFHKHYASKHVEHMRMT